MTDDLPEFAETVALRDLIETDPRLAGRVGIGGAVVPGHESEDDPPLLQPPYVVLYGGPDSATAVALTGSDEWSRDPSWVVHGVGDTELGAIAVLGWVDQVLRPRGVGVCPAVPGRTTGRVRRTDRPGNVRDDDAKPPVWSAIATYRFRSSRTIT